MGFVDYLYLALAVIGGASTLAFTLRNTLPALRAYALQTAWEADDAFVEKFAALLDLVIAFADVVHFYASRVGLNPRGKPTVTQNGKEIP